jgi:hypothetical protein
MDDATLELGLLSPPHPSIPMGQIMQPQAAGSAPERWQSFMDEASDYLESIGSRYEASEDAECARRILQSDESRQRWRMDFGNTLQPVAKFSSRMLQVRALRQASFTTVHRAAPFQYMRGRALRGERRRRLIAALYGESDHYERAMVNEYDVYVRNVCNGFCSSHLGEDVLGDKLYRDSIHRYQTLYLEYFHEFGLLTCGPDADGETASPDLLPLMKKQLEDLRKALLEYPLRSEWLRRESDMRQPTGDTQELELLRLNFLIDT